MDTKDTRNMGAVDTKDAMDATDAIDNRNKADHIEAEGPAQSCHQELLRQRCNRT